jgi:endonuclease/exonuclease/phosphatase (EEP) superfamily protein YafD
VIAANSVDDRPAAGSWQDRRPTRRFQGVLVTVAGLAVLPAMATTVLRLVPPTDDATALVASFIAYGLIGYLIAFGCLVVALLRARRRVALGVLTTLVAVLMSGHLAWLGPFFVPDHRPATTPSFTLLSLNLHNGLAAPAQVLEQARQADIVVFLEATPFVIADLRTLGWDARFPYVVGDLNTTVSDTMVYSRFPLRPGTLLGGTAFQQWATTVKVPGLGDVGLIAAHPCNPYCGNDQWFSEHQLLNRAAAERLGRPLIVAGDFNAVDDHGPMVQLRRMGLKSATDVAGAGWLPTWPADRSFPPLIPIDHVMIDKELTATAIRAFTVTGSDHRGLVATLAGAS